STTKITTLPARCRATNDAPRVVFSTIGRIRRSLAERGAEPLPPRLTWAIVPVRPAESAHLPEAARRVGQVRARVRRRGPAADRSARSAHSAGRAQAQP